MFFNAIMLRKKCNNSFICKVKKKKREWERIFLFLRFLCANY